MAAIAKKQILENMTSNEADFHKFFCNLQYVKYGIQKGRKFERKGRNNLIENENKFMSNINSLISSHKNSLDIIPAEKKAIK